MLVILIPLANSAGYGTKMYVIDMNLQKISIGGYGGDDQSFDEVGCYYWLDYFTYFKRLDYRKE